VRTRVIPVSKSSIQEACQILLAGDLVAFPTETVYGLGGLGLNTTAVRKIFEAKGRPSTDPLILHLSSSDLAQAGSDGILASPIPKIAQYVTQRFWPGPLTLILPKGTRVPTGVTSGLETVAVRCPSDPSASLLLKHLGQPLAAPSANRFGRISPTDASAVLAELEGKIPLILDGGPCTNGIESTVLSLSESKPVILRPGSIDSQTLSSFLQMDVPIRNSSGNVQSTSPAPGMLDHHYSPITPLYLCSSPIKTFSDAFEFIVYVNHSMPPKPNIHVLTNDQQGSTAAKNLYRTLRNADQRASSAILIDPIPNSPWAPALSDRLQRASSGTASWSDGQWQLIPRVRG
jgi:L-threonylcarbamoyladenylate synthase